MPVTSSDNYQNMQLSSHAAQIKGLERRMEIVEGAIGKLADASAEQRGSITEMRKTVQSVFGVTVLAFVIIVIKAAFEFIG